MRASARTFFEQYTRDLTPADFQRLFTRDTPEAYRYFTRAIDLEKLALEPWYRRWPIQARLVFTAFTMRLSPARRVLYALAMMTTLARRAHAVPRNRAGRGAALSVQDFPAAAQLG